MTNWKAIGARITLFLTPETPITPQQTALTIYRDVWKSDPMGFQDAPAPNFPSNAQGKAGELIVACQKSQNRVDFNFSPVMQHQMMPSQPKIHTIENATQLKEELKKVSECVKQLWNSNTYSGFALLINFVKPDTKDISDANKQLMSAIPNNYKINITDEEDFILQINKPYLSATDNNIRTNMIIKWSIDRMRVLSFPLGLPGITPNIQATQPGLLNFTDFMTPAVTFETNNIAQIANIKLQPEAEGNLLLEGLTNIEKRLQEFGVSIDGF